jgi:hypothetical protein
MKYNVVWSVVATQSARAKELSPFRRSVCFLKRQETYKCGLQRRISALKRCSGRSRDEPKIIVTRNDVNADMLSKRDMVSQQP